MDHEELKEEELEEVTGGSWISDAWDATCDWCSENSNTLIKLGCVAGGIALCATGIGAAAGLGLVAVESAGAAAVVATGVGSVTGAAVGAIVTSDKDN